MSWIVDLDRPRRVAFAEWPDGTTAARTIPTRGDLSSPWFLTFTIKIWDEEGDPAWILFGEDGSPWAVYVPAHDEGSRASTQGIPSGAIEREVRGVSLLKVLFERMGVERVVTLCEGALRDWSLRTGRPIPEVPSPSLDPDVEIEILLGNVPNVLRPQIEFVDFASALEDP